MDQSLRTVATQLLNVTSPKEILNKEETKQPSNDVLTKLIFVDAPEKEIEEKDSSILVKTTDSLNFEKNVTKRVSQERPINSKFGFLESSHPGEAMALTEEELEKELSSIRHPTKVQPTTTGGISTWILLNPPSATTDLPLDEEKTKYPPTNEGQLIVKTTSTIQKVESDQKVTASVEKVSALSFEKINTQVPKKSTPNLVRKSTTPSTPKFEKLVTKIEKVTPTPNAEKTTQFKKVEKPTTPKSTTVSSSEINENSVSENFSTTPKQITTKKIPSTIRTTVKPKTNPNNKNSTLKNVTTKAPKPQNKPKTTPQRKVTKPEGQNDISPTPKIEKVTFKPVQMIASPSSNLEVTEVPMFITKIKASVYTETKKTTPEATVKPKVTTSKPSPIKGDTEPLKSKPSGNKGNIVLKVQLKKPVDDMTKIEIEPIKVNAPVLKIEKVDNKKNSKNEQKKDKNDQKDKNDHKDKNDQRDKNYKEKNSNIKTDLNVRNDQKDSKNDQDILNNSKIDLKFDFNPELTRINVESVEPSTTTVKTTSKRRQSSKRKKNKNRRRKPSTTESTDTALSALSSIAEALNIAEPSSEENAIQESKIEPETKTTNNTKLKKKQVQKPISTQIYNFLSREVMPSFGVMSLVGLGLGLASYFLYPFGGSIARRNYDVEPNYKYNLDEYGGNYGQNEEEVFSKVLEGMTKHDNKFGGIKEYENNYYKYHHYDGPYSTTTRKTEQRPSTLSGPIYRPADKSYDVNYRNTEFKYPDLPTTPNYYERQKQSDFVVGKEVTGNRQFVVGNIPKEYNVEEKASLPIASKRADYENTDGPSKFEREMAQNFNFPKNSVNIPQAYTQVEPIRKNDDVYEEIEITPTAVAVEHGPRLLRVRRSMFPRIKRDSVIQLIPSKSEIEKEHQEEEVPLSNEIFDIIDSALPVDENELKKELKNKMHDEDIKKKLEEEKDFVSNEIVRPDSTTKFSSSSDKISSSTVKHLSTNGAKIETVKSDATTSNWITKSSTHSRNDEATTEDWFHDEVTTEKPKPPENEGFSIFSIVKKIAEIKIKLGLTLLKHASEGFARYLGHVQKKFNGEE